MKRAPALIALAGLTLPPAALPTAPAYALERVSVGTAEQQAEAGSGHASLAQGGAVVFFSSPADNLVANDDNGENDVFVRELNRGATIRLSVGPGDLEANGPSIKPVAAAGGQIVAYQSEASNLVPGDRNGLLDVFLRDRKAKVTRLVSAALGGDAADGISNYASISRLGGLVAFQSAATNLVAADTNGVVDIFVRDIDDAVTTRVSVGTGRVQANGGSAYAAISGDGRYVAFQSTASNLVAGDANGKPDVFVHDRVTGTTACISLNPAGRTGNATSGYPAISRDGRYVAFVSAATDLIPGVGDGVDLIYLRDRLTGELKVLTVGLRGAAPDGDSFSPEISADGSRIVFGSYAGNLVADDTNGARDVFLVLRDAPGIQRVSVAADGTEGNGFAFQQHISADGAYVVFTSSAANLIDGDTNRVADVFLAAP